MALNESAIRRIIREESFRFLNEGEGFAGLKIIDFEWDDMHNDGGMRTQGGELTIMFYTREMHDKANVDSMEAKKYISSYTMSSKGLVEDLTDAINDTLEEAELLTVDAGEVREALGGDLEKIMGLLRQSEKIYQDAADEADRYGGGDDFFESRRARGQNLREGEGDDGLSDVRCTWDENPDKDDVGGETGTLYYEIETTGRLDGEPFRFVESLQVPYEIDLEAEMSAHRLELGQGPYDGELLESEPDESIFDRVMDMPAYVSARENCIRDIKIDIKRNLAKDMVDDLMQSKDEERDPYAFRGLSKSDFYESIDRELDESKGMTFRISPDMPAEILRNLRPGDKIPAEYLIPSSLSPEEGPGARAAMRLREPEIIGMKSLSDYEPSSDWEEEEEEEETLDEAKRSRSVMKKGGKKASAGSVAIFKKAAAKKKGSAAKKKRAGFDAVKKSAEKWADDPAAVAQAATMVATGKPVVAKGEKRKLKKESIEILRDQLIQIIREG